jgi:tetratricopeptide (TPR) repeat protein
MKPDSAGFAHDGNTESQRRCAIALGDLLTYRGNPSREVDRVLADDPGFVFGHCLRAALIVRADDGGARPRIRESIAAIEEARPDRTDPARRHAAAARAWLDRDQALALERYAEILDDSPRDLLALVAAHALDFRLSHRHVMRDRTARIVPEWHAAMPGYASVLAMHAFSLEENQQYAQAERTARRVLAIDPRHAGAIHVMTHVMEMQGRAREGLDFLAASEPAWTDASNAIHLVWHRALLHLDTDDPARALALYDTRIARSHGRSDLADASALLWRLELRNVRLGTRWEVLADRWEAQPLAELRPFHIAHAMMAFAAAGRAAAAQRVLDTVQEMSGALAGYREEALLAPLCRALLAFARGDYAECVDRLRRVRHIANRCGGSLAQCDLIYLTLVEAALRASKTRLAALRRAFPLRTRQAA